MNTQIIQFVTGSAALIQTSYPVTGQSRILLNTTDSEFYWDYNGTRYKLNIHVQADYALSNSTAKSYIKNKPKTISASGITDVKISDGTITIGTNSITPLTQYVKSDWKLTDDTKASFILNKPTLSIDKSLLTVIINSDSLTFADVAISGNYQDLFNTPLRVDYSLSGLMWVSDKKKLDNLVHGYRGIFDDRVHLLSEIPTGISGEFVLRKDTNTVWMWDSDSYLWINTGGIEWVSIKNKPLTVLLAWSDAASKLWVSLNFLSNSATIDWSNIDNTPTTVSGYGISDAATTTWVSQNFVGSNQPISSWLYKILSANAEIQNKWFSIVTSNCTIFLPTPLVGYRVKICSAQSADTVLIKPASMTYIQNDQLGITIDRTNGTVLLYAESKTNWIIVGLA